LHETYECHPPPPWIGHLQIACRKQYEARYPGLIASNVGNHPNAYTAEILAHLAQTAKHSEAEAATKGGGSASTSSAAAATAAAAGGGGVASGQAGAGMLDDTFELGAADLASLEALERATADPASGGVGIPAAAAAAAQAAATE
jgi:hypothetical protein